MYIQFIKRFIDVATAIIAVAMIFPALILFAIIGTVVFRGNPFFLQTRAGEAGRPFRIIKFRSMSGSENDLRDDIDRINAYGVIIRRFSIDELPQLLNVLKGDMSLVGPRPLYLDYIPLYNTTQKRRLSVKPGITGWAQVKGRNSLSWEDRFDLDVWYVDNISFILDMKVVLLTLRKLLIPGGESVSDFSLIDKFKGSGRDQ